MTTQTPTYTAPKVTVTESTETAITAATVTVTGTSSNDAHYQASVALNRYARTQDQVAAVDRAEQIAVDGNSYTIRYF